MSFILQRGDCSQETLCGPPYLAVTEEKVNLARLSWPILSWRLTLSWTDRWKMLGLCDGASSWGLAGGGGGDTVETSFLMSLAHLVARMWTLGCQDIRSFWLNVTRTSASFLETAILGTHTRLRSSSSPVTQVILTSLTLTSCLRRDPVASSSRTSSTSPSPDLSVQPSLVWLTTTATDSCCLEEVFPGEVCSSTGRTNSRTSVARWSSRSVCWKVDPLTMRSSWPRHILASSCPTTNTDTWSRTVARTWRTLRQEVRGVRPEAGWEDTLTWWMDSRHFSLVSMSTVKSEFQASIWWRCARPASQDWVWLPGAAGSAWRRVSTVRTSQLTGSSQGSSCVAARPVTSWICVSLCSVIASFCTSTWNLARLSTVSSSLLLAHTRSPDT